MIKFIHYYTTGSDEVKTFYVAEGKFAGEGTTHAFTSPEEAVAKSTVESFIVWDGKEIGVGAGTE